MRRAVFLCLVAACGGNGGGGEIDADLSDGEFHPPDATFDPLDGVGDVVLVADGYQFTEGPQWREATGDLVFSDIPASTIYRYTPGGGPPEVLRMPSGNSNGLAIDPSGNLLAAEHGSRSITRTTQSGTFTVVDSYQGMRLNSPNDVTTPPVPGAALYFTDPPYGIDEADRELPFNGVFRLNPTGQLFAEHMGALSERPNGIAAFAFHVYVTDTADANVYVFDTGSVGELTNRRVLTATSGNPDGMAVDYGGNLFVATATGIEVFGPDGTRYGVIPVPQQPANCAFGDADHRTLYITAQTAVYSARLAYPGEPSF